MVSEHIQQNSPTIKNRVDSSGMESWFVFPGEQAQTQLQLLDLESDPKKQESKN